MNAFDSRVDASGHLTWVLSSARFWEGCARKPMQKNQMQQKTESASCFAPASVLMLCAIL